MMRAAHIVTDAIIVDSCTSLISVRRQIKQVSSPNHRSVRDFNDLLYLFSRPILIPLDGLDLCGDDLHNGLTATIVFNCALVYHYLGKLSGIDAFLTKAMDLYRLIVRAQLFSYKDTRMGIIPSSLLQCLVFNNLAHLHHENCEYNPCYWCMQCLFKISGLTDCLDNNCDFLLTVEAEEIKLNSIYMQEPTVACTA